MLINATKEYNGLQALAQGWGYYLQTSVMEVTYCPQSIVVGWGTKLIE